MRNDRINTKNIHRSQKIKCRSNVTKLHELNPSNKASKVEVKWLMMASVGNMVSTVKEINNKLREASKILIKILINKNANTNKSN